MGDNHHQEVVIMRSHADSAAVSTSKQSVMGPRGRLLGGARLAGNRIEARTSSDVSVSKPELDDAAPLRAPVTNIAVPKPASAAGGVDTFSTLQSLNRPSKKPKSNSVLPSNGRILF